MREAVKLKLMVDDNAIRKKRLIHARSPFLPLKDFLNSEFLKNMKA